MKRIVFASLVFVSLFAIADCSKKDTSQKDNLTQLLLAGGGSSGAGSSCVKGGNCVEVLGYPPAGFDFASWCASQSSTTQTATVTAGTCTTLGFTKCSSLAQALASFQTCTR